MRDCLSVCGDSVMLLCRKDDILAAEAREDALDEPKRSLVSPMRDKDQRLVDGRYAWSVEGMDAEDGDIGREMTFESSNLWSLARSLSTDNGS